MVASRWAQFRALMIKNFSLQRHQVATTLVQLFIPFVLVMLVGLIQMLIDNLALENSDPTVEHYGKLDLSASLVLNPDGSLNIPSLFIAPPFYLVTADPAIREEIGALRYNGTGTGILGKVEQVVQPPVLGLPLTFWPFGIEQETEQEQYDLLIEIYRKWKVILNDSGLGPAPEPSDVPSIFNSTHQWMKNREYEELLPYGAMVFEDLTETTLKYKVLAATRYGGWEAHSMNNESLSDIQFLYLDIDRRGNLINVVNNAYLSYLNTNASQPVHIHTMYQGFPQSMIFTFDISSIAGLFLYGFVSSMLFPVFISNLVTDKQEKILLMMQMSGLRMSIYWLVAYIYDMFLYFIVMVVIFGTSLAFKMRLFTQTDFGLLFLFFFLWGNVMISLCFFFSTFFSKSRTASVFGYLIVIITATVSNLLNSSVFLAKNPPFYYMMYPPFAFFRGVFVFEEACIDLKCFQWEDLATNENLQSIFWYLFVESLVLFPLTYYLQSVLPNEFGVRKSPLFFLGPFDCLTRSKRSKAYEAINDQPANQEVKLSISADNTPNERQRSGSSSFSKALESDTFEDEDVIEERRRIENGEVPASAQVVVNKIYKEYEGRYGQPKKVAIKGVSFFIDENECFGLLGGNGAGKTSLISILTGVFATTSGTAIVAGYDIGTEMEQVQNKIGVCPQFDIFYPELTTREHLLFYARLKGLPNVTEVVRKTLHEMELTSVADRQSRNLSGGMRRRLSMGIAIIGDPKIIILDEPTTGLDPLTRRQVWECLAQLKENRSMILTTHSMEEADVLCTRIGIMSRGRLKCIGTQERLKAKFGTGYSLTIFCAESRANDTKEFVESKFPFAELEEGFAGTLTFKISKEKLVVSELFRVMLEEKPSYINDWGLSMATLEDVFVNIARKDEMDQEALPTE